MPCDTIRTINIDLTKADKQAVSRAMKKLGFEVRESSNGLTFHKSGSYVGSWDRQRGMSLTEGYTTEKAVKNAYAGAVVDIVATRHAAWRVTKKSENKFVFQRSF